MYERIIAAVTKQFLGTSNCNVNPKKNQTTPGIEPIDSPVTYSIQASYGQYC